MDTPLGSRPLTYDEIRRVNGGDKCFFYMTPKALSSTLNSDPSNIDANVPDIPPHVTTGCPLILGNPSRYGMVHLHLTVQRQKYGSRSSTSGQATKSSNSSGQSGHYVHPSRWKNVPSYGSKTVSAVDSVAPTYST